MHKRLFASNRVPQLLQLDSGCVELNRVPQVQIVVHARPLVSLTDPGSAGAEKFRALAIRLRNFQKRQRLRTLLVTSSVKGEGKSVISANLALTLSQWQRTLLIDCDLHQSGLKDALGGQDQPGLADWWRHSGAIIPFVRRVDALPLWYLPAGQSMISPLELFQSPQFSDMLNQTSKWFDWVILDSPPLVPVADSGALAGHADGTLLVVRQGSTPKPLLREALKTENLKLLGIIANDWQSCGQRYYSQYYRSYGPARELRPADDSYLPATVEKDLD